MSVWLDKKYVYLLSANLPLFTERDEGVFNFRCTFCGDSDSNSSKSRGYLLAKDGSYYSYCHNCHASYPFYKFLEKISPVLYGEYLEEKIMDDPSLKRYKKRTKDTKAKNVDDMGIPACVWLDKDHPAAILLAKRKIPLRWKSRLFYAENFNAFANKHIPDKYDPAHAEPRIVIPLRSRSGKLIGFQGRAIDKNSKMRYITALLAPDNPKLFNMDRVDLNTINHITEGPFDSMFLDNAIASCGGDIVGTLKKSEINDSKTVVVYDNEPRNKDITRQMEGAIKAGYRIVIWPKEIMQKDINDMVLAGHEVQKILVDNTYNGLEAEMMLQTWRR